MSPAASPTVRRRRLGAELRQLREAAGLTGDQVIAYLGWASASKVSRIENGRNGAALADIRALLDLYRVTGSRRDKLLSIARDASNTKGWLRGYPVMTRCQRGFAELEAGCSEIREYGQFVVPGLLQSPGYARWRIQGARMLATAKAATPSGAAPSGEALKAPTPPAGRAARDIDAEVAARTARRHLLTRAEHRLRYDAVLEEAAFTRRAGPPEVLAEQLEDLCRLADLPHVTLRLLPVNAVIGRWHVPTTSFSVYQFADPEDPGTVAVEVLGQDVLLGQQQVLTQYLQVYDWLCQAARTPDESRHWLADATTRIRRFAAAITPPGAPMTGTAPRRTAVSAPPRTATAPTQRGPRRTGR